MAENLTLVAIQEAGKEPSLKAIAEVLGVQAQRIYSVAKQPKAGEVYDARVYNWDAIDRFITKRFDPDKGLATHADVIAKALEMDVEFQAKDGRKGPRGTTKEGIKMADGTIMPARKAALEIGQRVMLKKETAPTVYIVALLTETHVVLQPTDSTALNSYSNWTINQKIVTNEADMEKLIEDRTPKSAEAAE